MSSGTGVNRRVARTKDKKAASPKPIASCAHCDLPIRLAMRRSGRPGWGDQVGLEQTMQMDDVITYLRVVDRRLRLGAPGALGAGVVGEEADDIELLGIAEFVALKRFQLAAEHQVQALRLRFVLGLRIRRGHGSHFLEDARSSAARRGGLCLRGGENASIRKPPPVSLPKRRWRRESP